MDGLRFGKGALEIRAVARADVENRHFEDQCDVPSTDAACAHPLIRCLFVDAVSPNDGLRFGKSPPEIRAVTRADVEDRHFEDHGDIPSADAECAHPLNAPSVPQPRQHAELGAPCTLLVFFN
jgi:hypothetical protein